MAFIICLRIETLEEYLAQYRFTRMKRTTQLNLESYCFPARPTHPVSVSTSFYQTIGMCLEVIYLKYGATTGGQYKINLAEIHLRLYIANANGTLGVPLDSGHSYTVVLY